MDGRPISAPPFAQSANVVEAKLLYEYSHVTGFPQKTSGDHVAGVVEPLEVGRRMEIEVEGGFAS